jgi:hypothetical protein
MMMQVLQVLTNIKDTTLDPHVSNFDRTRCLAGCEERWWPGGREVVGRRVIIIGPQKMVLIQTQQETCGRWTSNSY